MQSTRIENQAYIKHIKDYVYDTRSVLGVGNFSKVYIGRNEPTNTPVAIKVIQLESLNIPKLVQLHHSQINILKFLNHPNVIKCYQIINIQQQCYIITELCDGGDLDVIVKKQGCLTQQNAAHFIKDIFEGLVYLANISIVHRDIKIANVLINKGQAKIADFGFAVVSKQNFIDMNIGSPLYMSPQGYIDCSYGPKTDVWALGILIFQLLHGYTPYFFCKLQVDLKYHLSMPFDRSKVKEGISAQLKEVIFRCLQVDYRKRISIFQLRETNYFKKLYNQKITPMFHFTNEKMFNSNHLIISNENNEIKRAKSIDNLKFNLKNQENTHLSPPTSVKQVKCNPIFQDNTKVNYLQPARPNIRFGRPISNQKISQHANSPQKDRMRIISFDHKKKQQKYIIFRQKISFKTVVNILHYCRCLFRYAQLLINQHQQEKDIKYVSGWLMLVLSQINRKINQGEIVYTGSNTEKKELKLREVRTDYQMRYTKQLKPYISNFINKPTLDDVKVFFYLTFRKYDIKMETDYRYCIFQIGYLTILLYDSTRLLVKCQNENDFSRFLNYKDIETALSWDHQEFNLQSYMNIKRNILT